MYEAITLFGCSSQSIPLIHSKLLGYSAFARRYWRNLNWFLFLKVLRCFSSLRLPLYPMYSDKDNCLTTVGLPHSEISDCNGCLSPCQSFSQITTSFFASYRLGIHRMRLISWLYISKYSRPFVCFSLATDAARIRLLFAQLDVYKDLLVSFSFDSFLNRSLELFLQLNLFDWLRLLASARFICCRRIPLAIFYAMFPRINGKLSHSVSPRYICVGLLLKFLKSINS